MLPFISVIIPVYQDWDRLRTSIDAINRQSYPKALFEVIIINNDPGNRPENFDIPENCILITEAQQGSYAARNTGIAATRGEILAFTDADCIPYPDWLEMAVFALQNGASRIAGKVELFFSSDSLTCSEIYEKAFAFDQEKNVRSGGALTANMITWKDHFKTVGLFNDRLMSGGDNEWGWRAQKKGINVVYVPSVVVRHPARRTIHDLLKKQKRVISGQMDIERMHSGPKRFIGIFRDLVPPFIPMLRLIPRKDLTASEKLVAGAVLAYLRLHRIYFRANVLLTKKMK